MPPLYNTITISLQYYLHLLYLFQTIAKNLPPCHHFKRSYVASVMVLQSGGMVAGYKVMVKTNTLSLKNGGVVAGFRPMFKTNIKNASNVKVIVL